jgi:hypothetical protein
MSHVATDKAMRLFTTISLVLLSLNLSAIAFCFSSSRCYYCHKHSSLVGSSSPRILRQNRFDVPYGAIWSTKNDDGETYITKLVDQRDAIDTATKNIVSPVLQQVYPDLVQYTKQYGHPNIPLGCEAGRQCNTLRRLRIQEKLVDSDIELLNSLHFTWHSFEDVYVQQKEYFDDFVLRLKEYSNANNGDLSPPKKYPADPELGAWVTAVRRLYMVDAVDVSHVAVLNALGFQWHSPRKCGSKFMQQYRTIQERLRSGEDVSIILNEPHITTWVKAQQLANLSETRKHYMTQIIGDDWMDFRG